MWAGVSGLSRPGSPSIDQHFADQVYEYAFCMSVSVVYAIAESARRRGHEAGFFIFYFFIPEFDWQAIFLLLSDRFASNLLTDRCFLHLVVGRLSFVPYGRQAFSPLYGWLFVSALPGVIAFGAEVYSTCPSCHGMGQFWDCVADS